jgi:hypothetical protein
VTVDGAPLSSAGVAFHPDTQKGNTVDQLPAGTTDENGVFELTTVARKGAPVGVYNVAVIPYSPAPGRGQPRAGKKDLPFNARFRNPKTSELSIEVTADAQEGTYDIKLTK